MTEDIIRSLGFLCLGSRMKRIGEQLQADAQRVLDDAGTQIPSGQHPLLAALDRFGPLSIGELTQALGITQPGVTRAVAQLADIGMVKAAQSDDDQRVKIVSLTPQGQRFVARAKKDAWPRVERAVADLCRNLEGKLLDQLAGLEDGLAAAPLDRRAPRRRRAS